MNIMRLCLKFSDYILGLVMMLMEEVIFHGVILFLKGLKVKIRATT